MKRSEFLRATDIHGVEHRFDGVLNMSSDPKLGTTRIWTTCVSAPPIDVAGNADEVSALIWPSNSELVEQGWRERRNPVPAEQRFNVHLGDANQVQAGDEVTGSQSR